LPNFPVAHFSAAHFSGCRFYMVFSVFVISDNFVLPFFSKHVNFRCRIFLLSNFPVAISSVAVFSVALFSIAVISHINFVLPCFPTLSFFVADFSYCPIFR